MGRLLMCYKQAIIDAVRIDEESSGDFAPTPSALKRAKEAWVEVDRLENKLLNKMRTTD